MIDLFYWLLQQHALFPIPFLNYVSFPKVEVFDTVISFQ